MPAQSVASNPAQVTAAVFVSASPDRFAPTLRSLAELPNVGIEVPVREPSMLDAGSAIHASCRVVSSPAALVNDVFVRTGTHILVVTDAAVVPSELLDQALPAFDDDPRVASVSFLCNDATFLSFPERNHPSDRLPDGHDESSV